MNVFKGVAPNTGKKDCKYIQIRMISLGIVHCCMYKGPWPLGTVNHGCLIVKVGVWGPR